MNPRDSTPSLSTCPGPRGQTPEDEPRPLARGIEHSDHPIVEHLEDADAGRHDEDEQGHE